VPTGLLFSDIRKYKESLRNTGEYLAQRTEMPPANQDNAAKYCHRTS